MSEEEEIKELEEGDIVEVLDEKEKIIKFRYLGVTEYKEVKYVVLLPAEPDENFAENDVVIFRLSADGLAFEQMDDENLLEEVFEHFKNEDYDEELS